MNMRPFIWRVVAILGGEIALILGTSIAQEVIFDGIRYGESSMTTIILGGLLSVGAAVLAGWIAHLIWLPGHFTVPVGICLLIALETWYLISTGKTTDPLWFSILAGGGLVVGIILGYAFIGKSYARRKLGPAA